MSLTNPSLDKMIGIIRDSFRMRANTQSIYVDIGDNLARIGAQQHQVIFGRRGSGKSCLLMQYLNTADTKRIIPVYVLADEYKRLTYPDILIRLLIEILEVVPVRWKRLKTICRRPIPTLMHAAALRKMLDMADEQDVVEDHQRKVTEDARAAIKADGIGRAELGSERNTSLGRSSTFRERKIDALERHLRDYKRAIAETLDAWPRRTGAILLDDFYLIPRDRQPDVLDYLHRIVRDTNLFLKVATIRHRTSLVRNYPQTIGVELSQDVEEISLDRTLEDLDATQGFLWKMLVSIAASARIDDLVEYFNPDALQALTLVSGGVPRDFLTIFVNAIDAARAAGQTKWLTPTLIYKGAGRLAYNTKLKNLRDDAGAGVDGIERLFVDLLGFCLDEKRKTAFLISQDNSQKFPREHELIQQLMDFKLIHVVEPDTSAASGRPGRYEAYTLDFSLFMEPRRRNIEIVEFWRIDDQSRRVGIREAPVYSLERARQAYDDPTGPSEPNTVLEESEEGLNETAGTDAPDEEQPSLFEPGSEG